MFALVAVVLAAGSSQLTEVAPRPEVFVGLTTGVGYSFVDHPLMSAGFAAPTVSLVAGLHVTSRVTIGFEAQSTAKWVEHHRAGGSDVYSAGVVCTTCGGKGPGGVVGAITATFTGVGPRVDFSLFGVNGPFGGLGVGVAVIQGLPAAVTVGFAASGHVGFRYRVLSIVELAAEAGVYGQRYSDSSVTTPYASASARLHF